MATTDGGKVSTDKNFILTTDNFASSLKERLLWSKDKWFTSGECGSRLNKLSNSMNYWKVKLKRAVEDTSAVITLFNSERDVKLELLKIVEAMESINTKIKVRGFSDFRNPRYLSFYFDSKEDRDFIMENFRMLDESFVVYLAWALDKGVNINTLKVHWLPMTVDLSIIKEKLSTYVTCIEEERISLALMSGRNMPSGRVTFKVKIKESVDIVDIPHVMTIDGMEALLTVSGRAALCLNCDRLGHISRQCKYRFCGTCNDLKLKEHRCSGLDSTPSYADKARVNLIRAESFDGGGIELDGERDNGNNIDTLIVAQKISGLEKQLIELSAESEEHKLERLEKKRKSDRSLNEEKRVDASNSSFHDISVEEASSDEDPFAIGGDSSEGDDYVSVWSTEMEKVVVTEEEDDGDEENKGSTKKVEAFKIATKKKKGKKKESNSKVVAGLNGSNKEAGEKSMYNTRRRKQEAKNDKLLERREFVFKD